jgi:hypothetical protein
MDFLSGPQSPPPSRDSSLFADTLGSEGGQQIDPETMRTIVALRRLLEQGQMGQVAGAQGGRNFINPIEQAQSLATLAHTTQPVMGPQSNGIKFLFPGP